MIALWNEFLSVMIGEKKGGIICIWVGLKLPDKPTRLFIKKIIESDLIKSPAVTQYSMWANQRLYYQTPPYDPIM